MKRIVSAVLFSFIALLACSCFSHSRGGREKEVDTSDTASVEAEAEMEEERIPFGAQCLLDAYPEQGMSYADNMIVFPDGTSIVYDDGLEKDFVTKLDGSDVEDMFSLIYDRDGEPDYLADAGRSRCDELFKIMYGHSAEEVRRNLVDVPWFGETVKFTRVNGADRHLLEVAAEIAADHPGMEKYMKSSGTFYWRKVRGANRQSAHSYGIAIDINVANSDYWLWKYGQVSETDMIGYVNRMPAEIVDVFEKHGFIWGGRWYHFDTMHFEYRPEILYAASL